jgi:hypothetical protein
MEGCLRNAEWILKGFVFGICGAALVACTTIQDKFQAQDSAVAAPYIGHTYYTKNGSTLLLYSQPNYASNSVVVPGKITVLGFYESPELQTWFKVALDNGSQGFVEIPIQSFRAALIDRPPAIAPKAIGAYPTFLRHLDRPEFERRRQLPGVVVGMSQKSVLGTAWGDPNKIETLKTKNSTREKWSYPDNNVLYFEDGFLVGIKTILN